MVNVFIFYINKWNIDCNKKIYCGLDGFFVWIDWFIGWYGFLVGVVGVIVDFYGYFVIIWF